MLSVYFKVTEPSPLQDSSGVRQKGDSDPPPVIPLPESSHGYIEHIGTFILTFLDVYIIVYIVVCSIIYRVAHILKGTPCSHVCVEHMVTLIFNVQ